MSRDTLCLLWELTYVLNSSLVQSAEHCVKQGPMTSYSLYCAQSLRPFCYCAIGHLSHKMLFVKISASPFCQWFAKLFSHENSFLLRHSSMNLISIIVPYSTTQSLLHICSCVCVKLLPRKCTVTNYLLTQFNSIRAPTWSRVKVHIYNRT